MMKMSFRKKFLWILISMLSVDAQLATARLLHHSRRAPFGSMISEQSSTGGSATILPDGRLLLLGGQDASGRITSVAAIKDLETGVLTPLPATLGFASA